MQGFVVGKLATEGPYFALEVEISKTGIYLYREGTMDSVTPKNNCMGDYEIKNNVFIGQLWCRGNKELINQEVDLTGVTKEDLAKGVVANVKSDVLGGRSLPFRMQERAYPVLPC